LLRQISDYILEKIRGYPPDLYKEGEELKQQYWAVQRGEVTDPEDIGGIRRRYEQWFRKVRDYTKNR